MKDGLYDLTKKLFTMSDDEGKELLFNETNIYDYDRVKMMISAFVQKKESLIVKSGNKLKFDLKKNVNEVWNIMFLSNYIEQITDRSIEEVKRNITILEDNKRNYYKNRNTSKTEAEKLYWDELINFNKISLDESKSILRSYLNAKAECAVILENKDEVEDLTFILEKLENAIQRIHTLRNVLSHKNTECEYETQSVVINEPSRRIVGRIPKEYLSGFAEGCINTRDEDKELVLKTNNELEELYNRYNIKIQNLNHFFYNVTPDRLSVLLDHISSIDKLTLLPHQLFTCTNNALLAIFNLNKNYNIPLDVCLKYLGFVDKYDISVVYDKIMKYENSDIAQKFIFIFNDSRGILERLEIFDYCVDNNYLDDYIFKFLSSPETFFKGSKWNKTNINRIKFVIKYFISNNITINFYAFLKYIAFSSYSEIEKEFNYIDDISNIEDVLNSNVFEILKLSNDLNISSTRYFSDIMFFNNDEEYLSLLKKIKNDELDLKFSDYYYKKIASNLNTLIEINNFCEVNNLDIMCFQDFAFDSFESFKHYYDIVNSLNFPVSDVGSKTRLRFISSISLHPILKNNIETMLKFFEDCNFRTLDILKKDLLSQNVDVINEHYNKYEDFYNRLFYYKDTTYFEYLCNQCGFEDDFDSIIEFYNIMKEFNFNDTYLEEARKWFILSNGLGNTFRLSNLVKIFLNKCPKLNNNFNMLQSFIFDFLNCPDDYFGKDDCENFTLSKFDILEKYCDFLLDNNILPENFYAFNELINIFTQKNMSDQIQFINSNLIKYYDSRYKNTVKYILDYYDYDINLFYKVPNKLIVSKIEIIEPMLKIHDQNMMKSLFGTNDHKLISLYSYVHSVMSTIVSPSTITYINEELEFKLAEMGYNEFSEQKWFINKLRNSVCHFRFKSDGNELNLWDTEDNVTVNFMTTISYEDLLELTRLIELSYSLEYVDYSSKGL